MVRIYEWKQTEWGGTSTGGIWGKGNKER